MPCYSGFSWFTTQYKKGLIYTILKCLTLSFPRLENQMALSKYLKLPIFFTKESSTIHRTVILCKIAFTDEHLAEKRIGLKELLNLFSTLRLLYLILHSLKKITKIHYIQYFPKYKIIHTTNHNVQYLYFIR